MPYFRYKKISTSTFFRWRKKNNFRRVGKIYGNFKLRLVLSARVASTLQQAKQWHMKNQPLDSIQLVLHAKSILKLCWTLAMVKKHIFFILNATSPSPILILLTFHLFFYCLGWKQWKLLCIAIWQWEKDAANLGQSLFFAIFPVLTPAVASSGKINFYSLEIFLLQMEIGNFKSRLFNFSSRFWIHVKLILSGTKTAINFSDSSSLTLNRWSISSS